MEFERLGYRCLVSFVRHIEMDARVVVEDFEYGARVDMCILDHNLRIDTPSFLNGPTLILNMHLVASTRDVDTSEMTERPK